MYSTAILLFFGWSDVDSTVGATSWATNNGDVWLEAFLTASRRSTLSGPWAVATVSCGHHSWRPSCWWCSTNGPCHEQACQSWRICSPGKLTFKLHLHLATHSLIFFYINNIFKRIYCYFFFNFLLILTWVITFFFFFLGELNTFTSTKFGGEVDVKPHSDPTSVGVAISVWLMIS